MKDECAHRACPLSLGVQVEEGHIQCAYHGWEFTTRGECVKMPSCKTVLKGVYVDALKTVEHDGMVFVCGDEGGSAGEDDPRYRRRALSNAKGEGWRASFQRRL